MRLGDGPRLGLILMLQEVVVPQCAHVAAGEIFLSRIRNGYYSKRIGEQRFSTSFELGQRSHKSLDNGYDKTSGGYWSRPSCRCVRREDNDCRATHLGI
jgi:hypothetical protein